MSGSRAARVVRGIAALAVLAGILVGVPIALLRAGGDPLDKHLPSWHAVWHAVTTADQTGHTFITVAIVVAWLAWLVFVVAVLLDALGRLRNRPPLRIPGLRMPQRAAAGLLTAVAMMMGTGAGPAAAAYAAPPPAVVHVLPSAAVQTPPDTDNGSAAPSEPAPSAPMYYTVARGDNLSRIAGRFFGDFDAYPKIAAANPQLITSAQGAHGPDHIDIGWKLLLPDGAHDRGPSRHANGTVISAPAAPIGSGAPTLPSTGPTGAPGPANPGPAVPPVVPPPLVSFGPAVPAPATAASAPRHHVDAAADGLVLAATALTAGALGAHLVLWRRRRAADAGATGAFTTEHGAAGPEPEAGPAIEFDRLDLALRDLAGLLGDRDSGELPDIMGAWLVEGSVHLMLTQPCPAPPVPWVAKGLMWTLPALSPTRRYFAGTTAPLPALVTVGGADDRRVFLDLERLGVVTVGGDPTGAAALLRHIGAELVQGIWSEGVQVGIAGFNRADTQQLVALGGGRVHASESVSEALDTAASWVGEVHDRLTAFGAPSVLSGRVSSTPADARRLSPYALVLAGPDADELQRLERLDHYLAGLGRGQIAIATTTQANMGRWPLRVDTDHQLTMEFLDTRVPAVALADAELAMLARMPESERAPGPAAAQPTRRSTSSKVSYGWS